MDASIHFSGDKKKCWRNVHFADVCIRKINTHLLLFLILKRRDGPEIGESKIGFPMIYILSPVAVKMPSEAVLRSITETWFCILETGQESMVTKCMMNVLHKKENNEKGLFLPYF